MSDKKNPYTFTIGFNSGNPDHIRAVQILNSLGRREKANYLARTILAYEGETGAQASTAMGISQMRKLIQQIISEEYSHVAVKNEHEPSEELSEKLAITEENKALLSSISKSMAAFRGQK